MALSRETINRISQQAAKKFPRNEKAAKEFTTRGWAEQRGYIEGAEQEALRCQILVDGLERVKSCCLATGPDAELRDRAINDILSGVEKTLTRYNKTSK